MRKRTDVYLLAENRLLREALLRLLGKKNEVKVVGANSYSPSVHEEIIAVRPHIILLDSEGLKFSKTNLISTLTNSLRHLRVVMVDMDSDENTFLMAVRAGVVGYILKDASAQEVLATIRSVASGEAVCPRSLSKTLFQCIAQQKPTSASMSWASDLGLSRREQQLVGLLRERLTNKEIAVRLNLSEQTVKNHIHRILRKLGAPNRNSVVRRFESERLMLDPPSVISIDSRSSESPITQASFGSERS
jgi:DNA-binding NarL/FixJ family response regulator